MGEGKREMLAKLLGGWFEALLFVVGFAVVIHQLWQSGGDRSKAKEAAAAQLEAAKTEKLCKKQLRLTLPKKNRGETEVVCG